MATYHFNLRNGEALTDEEGAAFADEAAARVEAVRYLAELLVDRPELVLKTGDFELSVTDPDGRPAFRLRLALIA